METGFKIFKAYDIRGLYPGEIDEDTAYKIGRSFVEFLKAKEVLVGRDMRLSSKDLFDSLTQGIIEQGADVLDLGEISTDALYFASGEFSKPAIMITASHLSSRHNGFKLCREDAVPMSKYAGLDDIQKLVVLGGFSQPEKKGKIIEQDILNEYVKHVLSFIDLSKLRPLKIVVDAGNGMAGKMIPLVFKDLPIKITEMYFELDGSFPNHVPNPIKSKNLTDLQRKVKSKKANLGIAFDGDGDRVFFVDEKGKIIKSSLVFALLVKKVLEKYPKGKVVYNMICSKIVPETIKELGGEAIIGRTGHSFIKHKMKETGAVFAGEHSGHYYFKENFGADSGLIAFLIILEIISTTKKSFSQLIKPFKKYFSIEQTNFKIENQDETLRRLEGKYRDGKLSHIDGLSVEYPDWRFSIRPSNTEVLLRLNLEANSEALMKEKFKEVSGLIL